MNEVRIFAGLLALLLTAAYMSWTREDVEVTKKDVTIWDVPVAQLERVELVTTTQTVAFSYRGDGDARYGWFDVTRRGKKNAFVANDSAEEALEKFAPFKALRSLGRTLDDTILEDIGLERPKRKLTVTANGQTRVYDLGNRTHGARDHYVRPKDSDAVYLVAARTVGDLELPDSKFMQRQILVKPLNEVDGALLAANGKTLEAVHKNRQDKKSAFWATSGEEKPNEQLGSFMLKLSRLTVRSYPESEDVDDAEAVLEIDWKDDKGESMGTTTLYQSGEGDVAKYYAKSDRTFQRGELNKTTAARLMADLASVLP